jgi:NhaP-type Na+/H+ or K+/H+ antiporter
VRPIVAAISTAKAGLTLKGCAFIGWMNPRSIVVTVTASSLSTVLVATKMPGADKMLPAAFVMITVTVFVYGLTAVPVAKALGVREETSDQD